MFKTAAPLIFSFCLGNALAQSPRDIGQLFRMDGIVPDLLPVFEPTTLLQVTYGLTLVPGQILSQNGTEILAHQ